MNMSENRLKQLVTITDIASQIRDLSPADVAILARELIFFNEKIAEKLSEQIRVEFLDEDLREVTE